ENKYLLDQIEKGKYKYPYQIYKVPVESDFLHHFVMPPSLISAQNNIEKNDHIDQHPGKNVETVKARDKEEKIRKQAMTVFIVNKIGPFYNIFGLFDYF